jgi:hypothetical protein
LRKPPQVPHAVKIARPSSTPLENAAAVKGREIRSGAGEQITGIQRHTPSSYDCGSTQIRAEDRKLRGILLSALLPIWLPRQAISLAVKKAVSK